MYSDASTHQVYGYGSSLTATYTLTNNLFYSTRAGSTLTTSSTITYNHNLYSGQTPKGPSGDSGAVVGEARFVAAPVIATTSAASRAPDLKAAFGLRLKTGSPAINAGVKISNNGGRDFAGTVLTDGKTDIGAFECSASA